MTTTELMRRRSSTIIRALSMACIASGSFASAPAFAWGDEGHEVIGLIADAYLEPAIRDRVQALLQAMTLS